VIRVTTAFAGVRPATARSIGHVKLRTVRYSRRLALSVGSMSIVASLVVAPAAGGLGAHENDVTPSYGVGVTRCTFVDRSRNVLDYATSPPTVLARQRTIVTEIRYPTLLRSSQPETTNAPPAPTFGYPLVVFAHGYDVTPGIYATLLERWAQRGFVVAAPIFPDENSAEVRRQRVDTEADLVNEPADMAFVIRQLLADSATLAASCPLVHGLVAPNEVALAGHSDGADAVALLADSNGRDPQGVPYARLRQGLMIRATMIFSGSTHGTAPYSAQPTRPPMLLVQSARDQCNAPEEGRELYATIHQNDKWFLELLHAHHLPPFDGEDHGAFAVVAATTTAFLDYTLDQTVSVSSFVATGNARPLVAHMTQGGNGPSIAPYLNPAPCGYH
jgi:dienelactone hydrolase